MGLRAYLKDFFHLFTPLSMVTMADIDRVAGHELVSNDSLVQAILSCRSDDVPLSIQDERVFPGDQNFLASGYYKTMLKRYFYAGAAFCRGKSVLDSCCGLGWGTTIVSRYAKNVISFDNNADIIAFDKHKWGLSNVQWVEANALNLVNFEDRAFDVALAMETIEHFTAKDGETYLRQLVRKVKPGGILIGTSAFPLTPEDADLLCKKNPAHLHVFTTAEMTVLLSKFSRDFTIIDQWMFIARL